MRIALKDAVKAVSRVLLTKLCRRLQVLTSYLIEFVILFFDILTAFIIDIVILKNAIQFSRNFKFGTIESLNGNIYSVKNYYCSYVSEPRCIYKKELQYAFICNIFFI